MKRHYFYAPEDLLIYESFFNESFFLWSELRTEKSEMTIFVKNSIVQNP